MSLDSLRGSAIFVVPSPTRRGRTARLCDAHCGSSSDAAGEMFGSECNFCAALRPLPVRFGDSEELTRSQRVVGATALLARKGGPQLSCYTIRNAEVSAGGTGFATCPGTSSF
jgi:hypothetical protein